MDSTIYQKLPAPPHQAVKFLKRLGMFCWEIKLINSQEILYYEISKNGQLRFASKHNDLFVSMAVAYALEHVGASTQDCDSVGE